MTRTVAGAREMGNYSMNTLELYGIGAFIFLTLSIQSTRRMRNEQWRVVGFLDAVFFGLVFLAICIIALDLLTHPDQIQPVPFPTWLTWILWFLVVLSVLGFFARLGLNLRRRMCQLGR